MVCPICGNLSYSIGTVPFNKNIFSIPEDTSIQVEYRRCTCCEYVFAPSMLSWTTEEFANKVYNSSYVEYDPDFKDKRPAEWCNILKDIPRFKNIRYLDYGSGTGKLVDGLRSLGFKNTEKYDPYYSTVKPKGSFDLVTAIEVIEHSPNLRKTIQEITTFLNKQGVVLISTQLSNKDINTSWWYIMPRNGHIGFPSRKTMDMLAKERGLTFESMDENIHILYYKRKNLERLFS